MVVYQNINKLSKLDNIYYAKNLNKLILRGTLGSFSIYLPSNFFIKLDNNKIILLFLTKFYFINFKRQLSLIYKKFCKIFYAKFRLKGLGFRTFFASSSMIYFFFNYSNYLYFYKPYNLFVKRFKKRFVLLSMTDVYYV